MSLGARLFGRRPGGADARPGETTPHPPQAEQGAGSETATPTPTLSYEQADARLAEGVLAYEAGRFDEALRLFAEVEASGAREEWAAFRSALVFRARGDEDAAEAAFDRAVARAPKLFWAHFERLRLPAIQSDRGKRNRAVEAIVEAEWEPLQPAHVAELEAVADTVWRDGKRDLAGRLLARMWPSDALGPEALRRIAETALDPALIEAVSERMAMAAAPPDPEPDPARERAIFDQAVEDVEAGRTAEAASAFEQLTATAGSASYRAWSYFYLGRIFAEEDEARALAAFDAAIAANPTLFWVHFERLRLAGVLTDAAERDRSAAAMVALDWEPLEPGHVGEIEAVAVGIWADGDRDLAGRLLARLWPSPALSAAALNRIVETTRDPALAEAVAARRESASVPPEPVAAAEPVDERDHDRDRSAFDEAIAQFAAGDLATARAGFDDLADAPAFRAWANFYRGRIHALSGDPSGARQAFDRALAADPSLFWAHFERLRALPAQGESAERSRSTEAILALVWEPLQAGQIADLEAVASALWNDGDRDLAGRLLARLWPSADLTPESLDRIVETTTDLALAEAVAARRASITTPAATEDASAERDRAAFDAAVEDFGAGRLESAATGFESLTTSRAHRAWANFYLGRIYAGEADQTRAWQAFDAAIAVEPTLFWAHFERLVLATTLEASMPTLVDYVTHLSDLAWEPIQGQHVRELERAAHAVWDRGKPIEAARLLSQLWPSTDLSRLSLVRIVEKGQDRDVQRQAADRLHSFAELDETALRVLSEYHQRHGEVDREIASLERAFKLKPKDFQTWLGLIRSYAKKGDRAHAFAAIAQGKDFPAKQRLFVSVIAHLELGDLDDAFYAFRDHCRLYSEVPKFPGIRIAYLLGDLFDVERRNEVVGILSAYFPDDKDVALVLINAAMRDQRWSDARAIFDRHFADAADMPQNVRLAHIDILAYSGGLEEAARLLEQERAHGELPVPFLRSSIRILSELDRWDEVFETGLAQLGDDHSFRNFLSAVIRASRKVKGSERLLAGLLALPRPLKPQQLEAVHAVAEDLAEQGHADILARLEGVELPFERRHRIELKLRGNAGPAVVAKDLCIYYCADQNYLIPALVSLTALAMSNVSITRRAVFHLVVDADVVPFAKEAGGAIAQRLGLSLEVTDASTIVSSADRLRTSYGLFTGGQQLSLAAYYRIFFARWLVDQKRYTQALYIDADTIVRSGLDEVFATELGVPLLARYETDRPEVRHATAVHQLRGTYFNSGVLRFDLDHPALPSLLDKAIAAAIDPEVNLIFQDQCALNIAFDMNMGQLPDRFNYFNPPTVSGDGISASDAVIVHFLDRPKPWDSLYRRRAREWFEWYDLVETLRQGVTLGA